MNAFGAHDRIRCIDAACGAEIARAPTHVLEPGAAAAVQDIRVLNAFEQSEKSRKASTPCIMALLPRRAPRSHRSAPLPARRAKKAVVRPDAPPAHAARCCAASRATCDRQGFVHARS